MGCLRTFGRRGKVGGVCALSGTPDSGGAVDLFPHTLLWRQTVSNSGVGGCGEERSGCWAGVGGEEGRYSGLASASPIVSVSASGSGVRRFTNVGQTTRRWRRRTSTKNRSQKADYLTYCWQGTAVIPTRASKQRGDATGERYLDNEVCPVPASRRRYAAEDTLLAGLE